MAPLLLGISIVVFAVIQAAPGGPEGSLLASGRFIVPQAPGPYRHWLGGATPLPVQSVPWIGAALRGDLGITFSSTRPVAAMIVERLPATLELMVGGMAVAALLAFVLGAGSALRP